MAKAKILDLIYRVTDQASIPLKNMKGASKSASGAFKDMGISGGIATAAILAAGAAAARTAVDFARQGAELERQNQKFERLAANYGTTGDALKMNLLPAMQGLVSDQEAVSMATDVMSLGLVKTQGDLVRLSSVASQLGFDMSQLTLTLTNQTTRRFDTLGLKVDGFGEKLAALKASGLDAQSAFTEAFLQQAEDQLATVGSVADSTEGSFQKLAAQWENVTDAGKKMMAEALGPTVGGLSRQVDAAHEVSRAMDELGAVSVNYAGRQFYELSNGVRLSRQELLDFIPAIVEAGRSAEAAHLGQKLYAESIRKTGGAIDDVSDSMGKLSTRQLYAKAYEAALAGDHALEQHYLDQVASIDDATSALDRYIKMAQIAAGVQFSGSSGNLERNLGGGGGGGSGGGWVTKKDALGRTYEYNQDTGEYKKHYQLGGVVPGPRGAPQEAIVHGGEQIIPAGGARADEAMLAEMRRNRLAIESLAQNIVTSIRDAVERAR